MICLALGLGALGFFAMRRARRCHHGGLHRGWRGHWYHHHHMRRRWLLHAMLMRLDATPAQERAISAGAFDLFDAQTAGRVGLRIQIGEQNSFANRRETSSQIDGGGGFSHSALLVGDRDNLGWHAADLRRAMR